MRMSNMKIRNDAGAWVDEEFETLDLGDPRRDRRAKELIKRFASRPTASIPGACEGWAETMAAYRFLGNERIDWRDICSRIGIAPRRAWERCRWCCALPIRQS
jgi:hypothetical protein